ncbi:MAG: hypothetical protein WBN89_00630 [Prochlorococcaceae cyanobacterium]
MPEEIRDRSASAPRWIGDKLTLKCDWRKEEKTVSPRNDVDKQETSSGSDVVVLNKKESSAVVDSVEHKAVFSPTSISWSKESIENNVGTQEATTRSYSRSIDRSSLDYKGFNSYKVEGGRLGFFAIYSTVTGSCKATVEPSTAPDSKI